jgi:hypothetical protein
MNMPDFDYMFALRLEYTDLYDNEYKIIQELKSTLLIIDDNNNVVNQHIINFYKEYNIDIDISALTIEQPEEKDYINSLPHIHEFIFEHNHQIQNIYNNINMINTLNDLINSLQQPEMVDVATPLDETEYTKIKTYTLEEKHDACCSICLGDLDKDEQVSCLPCYHIYHEECIMTYLKDYHRICPICRTEVGKRKEII